jgi:hypothetical protein
MLRSQARWRPGAGVGEIEAKQTELAAYDQSDHFGITRLTRELHALEDEVATVEARWLELSEDLN